MINCVFLGTGTSVGIPVIGCGCAVCRSADPRDMRRRSSVYIQAAGRHIVIDTPPDFREQVLRHGVERVDAVFFTHSHADHIFGFDDIRRFNTLQGEEIPAWSSKETDAALRRIFDYALRPPSVAGVFRPRIRFEVLEDWVELPGANGCGAVRVTALPVEHGSPGTLGFRIDAGGCALGYVPDCKRMPDATLDLLRGVDVMILDALRRREHPTHFTLEESLEHLRMIGAPRSFLIHVCHEISHAETEAELPGEVKIAHDGLKITLTESEKHK